MQQERGVIMNDEKKVWGIHTTDDALFLNDNAIAIGWVCIVGAAPFANLGFFKYHGMTAEKVLITYLKSEILIPKELKFISKNYYDEIERNGDDVRLHRNNKKENRTR